MGLDEDLRNLGQDASQTLTGASLRHKLLSYRRLMK